MGHINWNIAKESKRGNRGRIKSDGKIMYRDGSGDIEHPNYMISFYQGQAPDEIITSGQITVGSDGENLFISTNHINGAPKFEVKKPSTNSGRSYSCYGRDLVEKAIKSLTGITPKGDVSITFDLEEIGENTYKVKEYKIL